MNTGDLTTLDNAREWLGLSSLGIVNITNANPAVVTLAQGAQLYTGLPVSIVDVVGMTEVNNQTYPITVLTPTTFSIPVNSFMFAAYVSGGRVNVSDHLLSRMISSVSAFIQSWLNRTIRVMDYVDNRNGQGMRQMLSLQYPLVSVASLSIDGIVIQPRPPLGPGTTINYAGGYTFDSKSIYLDGYQFSRGYQNVTVSYAAGFLISQEAHTVPATAPYTQETTARWSAGDRGVVYASNGAALTPVTGTPSAGQYSVDGSVYTFAAADAGKGVLISYSYVPFDLEQAAVDMIGDWFTYKDRIGTLSQGIEAQSITFTNAAITSRSMGVLQQYKRVAPSFQ